MSWVERIPWAIVREESQRYGLIPNVVAAVIGHESGGDPYAIRYEPEFRYRKEPYRFARLNNITEESENILQSCSLGAMQVMGCRARELGHTRSLLELTELEVGIEIGCKALYHLYLKYMKTEDVLAAYNGGSKVIVKIDKGVQYKNQKYVDGVMSKYNFLNNRESDNGKGKTGA